MTDLAPSRTDPVEAPPERGHLSISLPVFLWLALWRWRQCAAICAAFVAVAVAYGLWQKPVFRAELVLSIVDSSGKSNGSLSDAISQLSGATSLVGINFSGNQSRAETLATLQSRVLARQFIQDNNLMPLLFPALWDAEHKTWLVTDPDKIPNDDDAYRRFGKVVEVTPDRSTGLVHVFVNWGDPDTAAQWANGIVATANHYLRDKAVAQSRRNLAYLNDQLAQNSVVEIREAIYRLQESEIKNIMVALGTDDYALKVIDPATPPRFKYKPQRKLLAVLGLLAGMACSGAWLVFWWLFLAPADLLPGRKPQ